MKNLYEDLYGRYCLNGAWERIKVRISLYLVKREMEAIKTRAKPGFSSSDRSAHINPID